MERLVNDRSNTPRLILRTPGAHGFRSEGEKDALYMEGK